MIGALLRELRDEKGLSQQDVATLLQISRQAYSYYELDKREPSYEALLKLAEIFNVTTDYLLGKTKERRSLIADQAKYVKSLKLDTPEDAIKFILEQPSIAAFGGYDLSNMTEDEIIDLANDILFAMKLSLERNKKKQ